MPQPYVPMATYAPVQPAVAPAPAIQSAPAVQMPVPATAPTPAPIPVPAPASASARTPVAPPPRAPTQMPQPHPIHEPPPNQAPVIPHTPVLADPVIPPPPIVTSEPRTTADAIRPRFTGFYRSADLPPPPIDEPDPMPEPARPPTSSQAGRTPFRTSMPMPSSTPMPMPTPDNPPGDAWDTHTSMPMPMPSSTPMPMPTPASRNPLPQPPTDVWNTSPYRQVLANLPMDISTLLDVQSDSDMLVGMPEPIPRPSSRLGGLFGSSSNKDKGKGPLRGLFRSRSNSVHGDVGSSSGSRHGHGHTRAQTMTSIVIPPPGPTASTMPVPTHGPPIKFDHTGDYAGFVNHSHHRVMYKNKMFPTALHLLEAMKFTHRPDLQERIRTCKDVNDMYPLSASFQEHVRLDWGQVFLQIVRGPVSFSFLWLSEVR